MRFSILFSLVFPVVSVASTSTTFTSPVQQSMLLELYTSEGCSSCPPADRWLSTLKSDSRLWNEIVPVAFHVDYWNYLGWKDKFSKAEFTQRQRNYARWNNIRTIYTPGFLQNGKEWPGWFRSRTVKNALGENVGRLSVTVDKNMVTARFKPEQNISMPVLLNVAWLGFDIETEVRAGENEGKKLIHDFVSYNISTEKGVLKNDAYHWQFKTWVAGLPVKKGAAFWVTSGKNPTPIQATGGWLKNLN